MKLTRLENHLDSVMLKAMGWPVAVLLCLIGCILFVNVLHDQQKRLEIVAQAYGQLVHAEFRQRLSAYGRIMVNYSAPECDKHTCLSQLLERAQRVEPATQALRLLDEQGAVLMHWDANVRAIASQWEGGSAAFERVRDSRRAELSAAPRVDAEQRVILTAPALDIEGRFIGALQSLVVPDAMFQDRRISMAALLSGDEIHILDNRDTLVMALGDNLASERTPTWKMTRHADVPGGWRVLAHRPVASMIHSVLPAIMLITLAIISLAIFIAWCARRIARRLVAPLNRLAYATMHLDIGDPDAVLELDAPTREQFASFEELSRLYSAVEHLVVHSRRLLHDEREGARALESANQTLSDKLDAADAYLEKQTHRLQDAMTSAWQAAEAKNRVLTNTSHEIRTPLNGIIGTTELLLRSEPLNSSQQDLLTTQLNAAKALLVLVDDILHLGRASNGLTLNPTPLDIVAEAGRVCGALRPLAANRGIDLLIDAPRGFHPYRLGDQARIRQILMGLVGNALKFTEAGSVTVLLDESADGALRIRVRDTGIGIPAEQLSRVFEPFYQVESDTSRRYSGTGLGLAIIAEIVKTMSGRITLESELGRGSTFTIELPLERVAASALIPAQEVSPKTNQSPLAGLRSLIVDDIEMNRELLEMQVNALGVLAQTAGGGQEALDMLETGEYDLLLLDCQMPGMDGYTTARKLRQRWPERTLYIIAVTAHAQPGELEKCMQAGMDDYVAKPVTLRALEDALSRAIGPRERNDHPLST